MELYYDFHVHSALSPCADDDMTPNNIVNMSIIKGLNVIALTDHNSSLNCQVTMAVGKACGLLVIPGMEIQTSEDVHLVVLFQQIDDLKTFQVAVDETRLGIPNKPEKFGKQLIFNEEDEVLGQEASALILGTGMSINKVFQLVEALNGFVFPAHIDRESNSIISNLGFVPSELDIKVVELSQKYNEETDLKHIDLTQYKILRNSDAHRLWQISEPENKLEVDEQSIAGVFRALKGED